MGVDLSGIKLPRGFFFISQTVQLRGLSFQVCELARQYCFYSGLIKRRANADDFIR